MGSRVESRLLKRGATPHVMHHGDGGAGAGRSWHTADKRGGERHGYRDRDRARSIQVHLKQFGNHRQTSEEGDYHQINPRLHSEAYGSQQYTRRYYSAYE